MDNKDNVSQFKNNLGKIAYTLDKEYFSRLDEDYYVLPYDECYNSEEVEEDGIKKRVEINSYVSNVRAMKISRLVYDKEQNYNDCFQNAISVFSSTGDTIAFVFNRFIDHTDVYAIVRNNGQGKNEESKRNIELFKESFEGNFPGSELSVIEEKQRGADTRKIFYRGTENLEEEIKSISAICNIPSGKSEEYLSQNLEKLFNGIVPRNDEEWYSVIIFADSITAEQLHVIREGYEELASETYPFLQHQFQVGENKAETKGEMSSLAHSKSTSVAISKTHSVNVGVTGSRFVSATVSAAVSVVSAAVSAGASAGASLGYGYSWGKTITEGSTDTYTSGTNHSITLGSSENTTYSYQSYTIKNILEKLELSLARLKDGEAIGFWKYATFVCAGSTSVSKKVANYIKALTQGKQSYIEPAIIKEWHYQDGNGTSDFNEIRKYILNFSHPIFINKIDKTPVTFTSNINSYEMANVISLPQHSIPGLPVTNAVSFGREPHSMDAIDLDLDLACAYHMYKSNEKQPIKISKNALTSHTFITGSTGSGKSNTVYRILSEVKKQGVKFLVIEPAKGEYKRVFGSMNEVNVYGTNPDITPLLRINPFSFEEGIHVLEHLDRLVEIFNVCWPMYAAMPAVLKNAIEQSYVDCGWNLVNSKNCYGAKLFPTFSDVARNVKLIIDKSDYNTDNKGAYKGSLLTRLNSLTNGIYGLIFTEHELDADKLFDDYVIADLSRIGSSETKSLIMGLLVLKLQEHRMNQGKINADLNHLTVLEEAHNILKRTSTEQESESANLIGKSVEMLSNAIAEMRSYGEGFIIADQSPGLLDMSAIRNTNTKIIMRLPDISDRELVGKAANLNELQIEEISKFPCGVAAIYQNEWIEPVLCKIKKYDQDEKEYKQPDNLEIISIDAKIAISIAKYLCSGKKLDDIGKLSEMFNALNKFGISATTQVAIAKLLEKPPAEPRMTKIAPVMCELFPKLLVEMREVYAETSNAAEWTQRIDSSLRTYQEIDDQTRRDIIQSIITHFLLNEKNDIKTLEMWSRKGGLI